MDQRRLDELRAAIVAAPADLGLRRVYADALMEQGDPRGEWIALCCACGDEPAAVERRRRALWDAHGPRWIEEDVGAAGAEALALEYRAGFVSAVRGPQRALVEAAPHLVRLPVRALAVDDVDDLAALRALLEACTLDELAITTSDPGAVISDVLARLEGIARLTAFGLHGSLVQPAHARWIAEALPALRAFSARGSLTTGALEAFVERRGGVLEQLDLEDCDPRTLRRTAIDDTAIARLLDAPLTAGLRALRLARCALGDATAAVFARLPCAASLTELELTRTLQPSTALGALADVALPRLASLDLAYSRPATPDLRVLAGCAALTSLRLRAAEIAPATATQIGALPQLAALDVAQCRLGDDGLRAVVDGACAPALRDLDVSYAWLRTRGIAALVASPCVSTLRTLNVSANSLDEATVRALADAPWLAMRALSASLVGLPTTDLFDPAMWRHLGHDTYEYRAAV